MFELFLKGCLIGFSIAMPVGPIGLLCIRHALLSGRSCGWIVGLGAASADAVYGALAGFGVTAVAHFLAQYALMLQWIGGAFLCYLGVKTFLTPRAEAREVNVFGGRLFLTSFGLTLTNPMTIISFAGIYVALGIGGGGDLVPAMVMTGGVFAGSALWWLLLSSFASLFKDKVDTVWLNKVSGAVIAGFGVASFVLV